MSEHTPSSHIQRAETGEGDIATGDRSLNEYKRRQLLVQEELFDDALSDRAIDPYRVLSYYEINKMMNRTGLPRIVGSHIRIQMDSSVWHVIEKGTMDWRDTSWTSLHLPGKRTCKLEKLTPPMSR